MNKLRIIFVFIIFYGAINIFAQNTESPYSRYGLGDLANNNFGINSAFGGLSIATNSPAHINFSNPASYGSIRQQSFVFELGLFSKFTEHKSEIGKKYSNNLNMGSMAIGFPITKWLNASLGTVPYSFVGYSLSSKQSILYEGDTIGLKESRFNGEGGITRYYFGNSVKIYKELFLGYNINYLYGKIDHTSKTYFYFNQSRSALSTSEYLTVKNFYLNLGLQYSLKIKENNIITLGATFDNETKVKSRQTTYITRDLSLNSTSFSDIINNDTLNTGNIVIPANYGFGITYSNPKMIIGFDYILQDWSKATFFENKNSNLTKSSSIRGGFEYVPDIFSSKYFKVVRYRIGGYLTNSYLQFPTTGPDNYEQIKDYGVTFGFEFPIPKASALINVSFEIGKRGRSQFNLIEEKYALIHLNFSLHDVWFLKYKFD